ncbi:MAG: FAD:protein FMN transferase [Bacillota bacterium]
MRRRALLLTLTGAGIVVTLVACVLWAYWRHLDNQVYSQTAFLMGTSVELRVYGRNAQTAAARVFDRLREIEAKMSANLPTSEISQVNAAAGQEWVRVSPDTLVVVKRALAYADLTDGRFNPAIGPLVALWGIGTERARVPLPAEIAQRLPLVDANSVLIDETRTSVYLTKPGMSLDLGGIAKGYGADEAARILRELKVKGAFVNLGGNVYAVGSKPDGTPWRIGIQDPVQPRGALLGVVETGEGSLVTSGAYERCFVEDGRRYHHILDPRDGYPAESDILSVTIVAASSTDCDALSTSVFILGTEAGLALIERLEGFETILVTKDKRVLVSSGLKERLQLRNEEYEIDETR